MGSAEAEEIVSVASADCELTRTARIELGAHAVCVPRCEGEAMVPAGQAGKQGS